MEKIVMLSQMRKEKVKSSLVMNTDGSDNIFTNVEENFNFENKFCKNNFDKNDINLINRNRLNEIINRIFLLNNKKPFIEFINEIFGDLLRTSCEVSYVHNKSVQNVNQRVLKDPNYNINIMIKDEYRVFEYNIQFYTEDYENIALVISKDNLSSKDSNIINFEQKKRQYKMSTKQLNDNLDFYLIMINSNIRMPDSYEVKEEDNENTALYRFNILKGWKYDFKDLYEKNLYLLFPLKIVDLKRHITYMKKLEYSNETIEKEVCRFFDEMNKYLKRIKEDGKIEDKDITEFNIISKQILETILS